MPDMPSTLPEGFASVEAIQKFVIAHWGWNAFAVVATVVLVGVGNRIFNAVFNEYVKRFWIKWVHPDEIAKAKAEVSLAKAQISVVQKNAEFAAAEVKSLGNELRQLLSELLKLRDELLNLRFENAWLRAENANLKDEILDLRARYLADPRADDVGAGAKYRSKQ